MRSRLLLAALAAILALLVAEGLLSLSGRGSLRRWLAPAEDGFRLQWDEERFAAAARLPGSYRQHPDPLVGYVLKADTTFDILGGTGRSDALGLRLRPLAPGAPGYEDPATLRVVVLGDSVAFGYGLDDEEVLAARLEERLGAARGPAARPVACRTVAMPGWNHRNAIHFLRDHFDVLDPDLVVYLPIENDLASARGVHETGQTGWGFDLGEEDPWLVVNPDFGLTLKSHLLTRAAAGRLALTARDLGPDVLTADVSPASSRRFDAMARAVVELEAFLRAQDARLALVQYDRPAALPILCERLHRLGLAAPLVPFLVKPLKGDSLGNDPHPNARTVADLATVVARALLAHGLLERGEDRPLPPLSEGLAERLAPDPTPERCASLAAAARAAALEALGPTIDWPSGRGVLQVFGSLSPQGLVGTRLLAVVRGGRALRIALEAVGERPDLYPMSVAVEIDGRPMEPLRLEAGRTSEAVYRLGTPAPRPIEVRLVPERWCVAQREQRSILVSFQLRTIEALDE